ncbi:MAG TPA: sodium:proton exchanger, partial [Firmicutes bacterium]|nr:sodium:proton exchanger [Bacillota bacterium]
HITNETVGLITLVGVVTIFISTYMILYSGQLYNLLSKPLLFFERKDPFREAAIDTLKGSLSVDIILLGLGKYGSGLAEYLLRRNKTILGVDFDPGVLDKWRAKGLSVLYGDMGDPEIYDHLPLHRVFWVVSTVRSREMNFMLIRHLKEKRFTGKIALTASVEEEALEFEKAGVHLIFRPFSDAAEQAVDALTYAMDVLPENIDWPISFLEVRIRSDASVVGKTLRDISLRSISGTSILAISRGGRVLFEPEPDFSIFPGDRLLIIGPPQGLKDAERVLNQFEMTDDNKDSDRFEIAEINVAENSELSGQTIATLGFRQRYKVTLVGIKRNKEQIITIINPDDRILGGDILIVIGTSEAVQSLKRREPI